MQYITKNAKAVNIDFLLLQMVYENNIIDRRYKRVPNTFNLYIPKKFILIHDNL